MKNWSRTYFGKGVLFLCCFLCLTVLVISVFGTVLLLNYGCYTQTEDSFTQQFIRRELTSDGFTYIWNAFYPPDERDWRQEASNLLYTVEDAEGKVLSSSYGRDAQPESWAYSLDFIVMRNRENPRDIIHVFYTTNPEAELMLYEEEFAEPVPGEIPMEAVAVKLRCNFLDGLPYPDVYAWTMRASHIAYGMRYWVYVCMAAALLLGIPCFLALLCACARRPHTEELFASPLHKIPLDLEAAAAVLLFIATLVGIFDMTGDDIITFFFLLLLFVTAVPIALGLSMSLAGRIKLGTLVETSVIGKCLHLCKKILCFLWKLLEKCGQYTLRIYRGIPLIWRTVLVVGGLCLLELIVMFGCWYETDNLLVWWMIEKLLLVPPILYLAISLRRLQKAGLALANGDLTYKTDTTGMLWDLKQHGEHLNSLSNGLSLAVEERMKSERMKTELITNVSHDIKTPLTSIINYANLIGQGDCTEEQVRDYSAVLVRQSERLKRLLEDLVEVSKASTGNLDVELAPCDPSVFLSQAAGEYTQKLENANLHLVVKQPEQEVRILADGRRMWRIFDNLMNNICKYAQAGTRVYLSLEIVGQNAVITFKNTSRDELDVTAEELMERFIRGDASRSTEGNGLGLSIARSLAELQKGTLNLSVDGDLFKAALTFPICDKNIL